MKESCKEDLANHKKVFLETCGLELAWGECSIRAHRCPFVVHLKATEFAEETELAKQYRSSICSPRPSPLGEG